MQGVEPPPPKLPVRVPIARGQAVSLAAVFLVLTAMSLLMTDLRALGEPGWNQRSVQRGVALLFAGAFGLGLAWQVRLLTRIGPGLTIDEDGVIERTGFLTRRLRWEQVAGARVFGAFADGDHPRLLIDLRDRDGYLDGLSTWERLFLRLLTKVDVEVHMQALRSGAIRADDLARLIDAEVARRRGLHA